MGELLGTKTIVALCERDGLSIVARLDRAPTWARFKGSPFKDFTDYGDFVEEKLIWKRMSEVVSEEP